MDTVAALKAFEAFEFKVGELFAWFREGYANDAEASLVFHKMHLRQAELGDS